MGKWEVFDLRGKIEAVSCEYEAELLDEHNDAIGHIYEIEDAEQIIREHNAHRPLVDLAKRWRDAMKVADVMCPEINKEQWIEMQKTIAEIDAVLARAEGRR